MATLHVRKMPDLLYEAIRERAEREGRSIGGEVICLLEEALLAQGLRRRLGVLRLEESRGARALASLGIDRDVITRAVVEDVGRGAEAVEGTIPFTPRAKKALELALRESLAARSGAVDTGHLLLGLARVEDGVAARLLTRFGADLDMLRPTLILRHGSGVVVRLLQPSGDDRYRVLELTGSADDWARALNDAAEQGWRLVTIERAGEERRAVLARE
jgi:plasmid stability protein